MKRFLALLGFTILFTSQVFSETTTLINFSDLVADNGSEHQATTIDYSSIAGTTYTDEDKAEMVESLFIENWDVTLNTSAKEANRDRLSYTKAVVVKETAKKNAGETVMGIRVNFPESSHAHAFITPPFDIPAFMPTEEEVAAGVRSGSKFDGFGVIKNVGVLKNISVSVNGRNYPHGLSLVVADPEGNEKQIYMGSLRFTGWRTLTWRNPNYVTETRNRELRTKPVYPVSSDTIILKGLIIHKDASQEGGDVISYIKDITVTYDKANRDDVERDIDDEEVWGILSRREEAKRNANLESLGNKQILEFLEMKKMDNEGGDEDKREIIPINESTPDGGDEAATGTAE